MTYRHRVVADRAPCPGVVARCLLLLLLGVCLCLVPLGATASESLPPLPSLAVSGSASDRSWNGAGYATAAARTPRNILPLFLGIPYRPDGVINEAGQYVLFNAPTVPLPTPGLNCSGLVLSAARLLLGRNITIAEAVRDREGDSGPDAPYGHDWDFGFDLIMNSSEGFLREALTCQGATRAEGMSGKTVPSFDIHGQQLPLTLLPMLQEDVLYLVSFSRHRTVDAPPRLHYHTGILVKDGNTVWLYSTTRNSGKVIRHDLTTRAGLAAFRKSFANTPNSFKRLTVLAVYPETAGK